jgi:hypothetical protein
LEEVAECAGQEVLVEIDNNILLIVVDPRGILDQHLSLHPIHLWNIIVIIKLNNILLN